MAGVKVNTEGVYNVAQQLKDINKELQTGFKPVKTKMSQLDGSWDGEVATLAMQSYNDIRVNCEKNGFVVIDNFANYLMQQVCGGYEVTEDTNTKLADAFK